MTDLTHDPEFPFVVLDSKGKPFAKFLIADDANGLAERELYATVIDTTPLPLPDGHGATVVIPGKMPLVRMYEYWIMPMETERRSTDGSHPLCTPLDYGKYYLSDDDVRKLIAAADGKYTAVEGSNG